MKTKTRGSTWLYGLAPVVLVLVAIAAFVLIDPLSGLRESFPPVEELTIERATLNSDPKEIVLSVRNGGPDPVTVAQVLIDEAYWPYEIEPGNEIGRLRSGTIRIAYPWGEGEAHEVVVLSSSGVPFTHEIGVAVETPKASGKTLMTFVLLGLFVGVIPVFLGLLFLPFLRRLERKWVNFFLALTAGLLVFIAVEAIEEALELAGEVPGAFQGVGLVVLGVVVALATLFGVSGWARQRRGELSPMWVAGLIALGIGLHNLGEGLAVGAAYALGETALTAFLILGFTLHNTTEGIGIVSPLATSRPTVLQLLALGAVAGVPTIAGTLIGGLAFSAMAGALFFAIGAGAIVQVVWEIGKLMRRETQSLAAPLNSLGFVLGIAVMYVTGLAVAS